VHEVAAAECDADVRRSLAHRFEEHEIARLDLVLVNLLADGVLLACLTGQCRPVLRKYPLDEPAAIESA